MVLKVNIKILKTIRYATGNQCRALSNGAITYTISVLNRISRLLKLV